MTQKGTYQSVSSNNEPVLAYPAAQAVSTGVNGLSPDTRLKKDSLGQTIKAITSCSELIEIKITKLQISDGDKKTIIT